MRFRADIDFLREFIQGPDRPKVALSLNGDELEMEVSLTFRRSARVAGLDPGLAVFDLADLRSALADLESGAAEFEALGNRVWVRSGRTEAVSECIYARGRP